MRKACAPGRNMIPASRNWQKINVSIQPMFAKGRRRKAIRGGLLAMALVAFGWINWRGADATLFPQGFLPGGHLLLLILLRPTQPRSGGPCPVVAITGQ